MTSLIRLAEVVDVVIGVDTHVATHAAAMLGARSGGVIDDLSVSADAQGYEELEAWAEEHAEIQRVPSYRADLERTLHTPRVRHHFGSRTAATTTQLLDDQPRFMEWLARLPETLCHHDAALANLFASAPPTECSRPSPSTGRR